MLGQLFICGLLGFAVSYGIILLALLGVRRFQSFQRAGDYHHGAGAPVARFGGFGLVAAFLAVICLAVFFWGLPFSRDHMVILATSLAMFGLGLWDDFQALGQWRKLFCQTFIATPACFLGVGIFHFKIPLMGNVLDLGTWAWPVTIFWIVGMTNLINLIDGVDGLAGGISLMLMLLLAVEGSTEGNIPFMAAGMMGALLAFLRFNFPPAKIYMGDGGAYFLGSLIGLLTIASSDKGMVAAALIAPLFVLTLPILDTSLTILRRALQGLPLLRSDRLHIHHRMLASGLSRRSVLLVVYAFTSFFLCLGFITFWWGGRFLPLILGSSILVVLLGAGLMDFSREWLNVGRVLGKSLDTRDEIHYAIAQARWLALEGARPNSLAGLCDDAAFAARKLGFASVRIRLEDGERTWQLAHVTDGKDNCFFRHPLPGHRHCFIEFGVTCRMAGDIAKVPRPPGPKSCLPCMMNVTKASLAGCAAISKEFDTLSDLLAEGWVKSIIVWEKYNHSPLRFSPRGLPPEGADSPEFPLSARP